MIQCQSRVVGVEGELTPQLGSSWNASCGELQRGLDTCSLLHSAYFLLTAVPNVVTVAVTVAIVVI